MKEHLIALKKLISFNLKKTYRHLIAEVGTLDWNLFRPTAFGASIDFHFSVRRGRSGRFFVQFERFFVQLWTFFVQLVTFFVQLRKCFVQLSCFLKIEGLLIRNY